MQNEKETYPKHVIILAYILFQVMESKIKKKKEVEDLQYIHIVWEPNEEPTAPIEPSQALFLV